MARPAVPMRDGGQDRQPLRACWKRGFLPTTTRSSGQARELRALLCPRHAEPQSEVAVVAGNSTPLRCLHRDRCAQWHGRTDVCLRPWPADLLPQPPLQAEGAPDGGAAAEHLAELHLQPRSIVIHRDGRTFSSELNGLHLAVQELQREGVLARDLTVGVVDIRKSTTDHLRLVEGEHLEQAQNCLVGSY